MTEIKLHRDVVEFLETGNKTITGDGIIYYFNPVEIMKDRKGRFFITDRTIRVLDWKTVKKKGNGQLINLPFEKVSILLKRADNKPYEQDLKEIVSELIVDSEYGPVWNGFEDYHPIREGDQWAEIQLP